MFRVSRKVASRVVPLALATAVVSLGAYFVGYSTISDMQRSHAEYVASSFGRYLVEEVGNLDAIVAGAHSAQVVAAVIGAVKPIGTVYDFRLFDKNSRLRADYARFKDGQVLHLADRVRNDVAANVLATSHVSFALRDSASTSLNREADRLSAVLEAARAQSRSSGVALAWVALFCLHHSL